jgi:outer membrane lipopolysaccharide assembly protein LptE/RlpB
MKLRLLGLVALAAAVLALAGCGYGFRGTVSNLPDEIRTVAIPFLNNRTGEPNLDVVLTQALIKEFNRSKLLKLTRAGQAHVVLKGTINSLSEGAVAYEDIRTALQRRVTVAVSAELTATADNKVFWKNRAISEGQDYDVAADPGTTEANREAAITTLVRNLAEKIHDSIFENF